MDLHDTTISWMIGGGLRGDPAESRNRAHLQALREATAGPTLVERARAFITGAVPVSPAQVDRVCWAV